MPAPIPVPMRRAVIALTGKLEIEEIAHHLKIGSATVKRVRKQFRETGTLEPKTPVKRGPDPLIDAAADEVIRVLVVERSDATLEELAAMLDERTGVKVSKSSMGRALQRLGITRKKKRSAPPSRKRRASRR